MKRLTASVLLSSAFAIAAAAAMAQTSSRDPVAAAAVRQVGQTMGDAMIALDVEKLDRVFADEWATIGSSGSVYTKDMLLRDIKAGKNKLVWYEIWPMDVQTFGDVAIVQGGVSEKRIHDGKNTDMKAVYADILKKRDGRWVVVRSISARIAQDGTEDAP